VAFAQGGEQSVPALTYLPAMPPLQPAQLGPVLDRDLAEALRTGPLAARLGTALAIGVVEHGRRRVYTYGAAREDSIFEIGSISKTFTGLLLERLTEERHTSPGEPVRELLPPGLVARPHGREITLEDLATHRSGLPMWPDNRKASNPADPLAEYGADELHAYIKDRGVGREDRPEIRYTNLGYALLGQSLADRTGVPFAEMLRREIADPLGLRDTTVPLSAEQSARLLQGHDANRRPVAPWNVNVFAASGGIRSTAGDMLTYLEAQLHPERAVELARAIREAQRLRAPVGGRDRIALGWMWDGESRSYWATGGTGGFSSYAFFDTRRDMALIVLLNARATESGLYEILGRHVRQRLTGEPALSVDTVVVRGGGGVARAFASYWLAMLAAGAFIYCCVLALQGLTAELLPRGWFLRASSWLQVGAFTTLVGGHFFQKPPQYALIAGAREPLLAWVPSYWFVGLFQQLNGTLHPALLPLAKRAWWGLAASAGVAAIAYALAYMRTVRRVVEEPDIVPGARGGGWLPRFGGSRETALVQFAIRTLMRSRQHRMILAFYVGLGFAVTVLLLKTPLAVEVAAGVAEAPLIAASVVMMAFTVIGLRVVFAMPLEIGANWVFRLTPVRGGAELVAARRRALVVLGVVPVWLVFAAVVCWQWEWKLAAGHLAVLGLTGLALAEFCLQGVPKIPFTCSYLPGKSNFHVTFWMCIGYLFALVAKGAVWERQALQSAAGTAALAGALAALLAAARWRTASMAEDPSFEQAEDDVIQTLGL
jgi:CubicO group peptidase (beta-lactamase class C family)